MKLRDVLPIYEGLARMGRVEVSAAVAFRVKRERGKIEGAIKSHDEARKELAAACGAFEDKDQPGRMTIPLEGRERFIREYEVLLDQEVEYTPTVIVKEADLEGARVQAEVLGLLGPLCE